MATTTILDEVKLDLRISSSNLDTDVTTAINTAKQRLAIAGVNNVDDTDSLTKQAIMLYCRGWFNYQGDAERYNNAFNEMVKMMTLANEYNTEPEATE